MRLLRRRRKTWSASVSSKMPQDKQTRFGQSAADDFLSGLKDSLLMCPVSYNCHPMNCRRTVERRVSSSSFSRLRSSSTLPPRPSVRTTRKRRSVPFVHSLQNYESLQFLRDLVRALFISTTIRPDYPLPQLAAPPLPLNASVRPVYAQGSFLQQVHRGSGGQ